MTPIVDQRRRDLSVRISRDFPGCATRLRIFNEVTGLVVAEAAIRNGDSVTLTVKDGALEFAGVVG